MKRSVILAALGLVLLSSAVASAAIQYAGAPGGGLYEERGGSVGSEFISNINANVIKLGIYDYNSDGLTGSHVVSLWDGAGTFITSATVSAGTVDPLSDGYRWVAASAPLLAGQHYVVMAAYYNAGVGDYIRTDAVIDPAFTFVKDRDTQGTANYTGPTIPGPGGAEYTTLSDWNGTGPTAWFGPNLQVVPEPATIIIWSLFGVGSLFGMRVWRRRGGPVGRRAWSPETRQAIHEMIARNVTQ